MVRKLWKNSFEISINKVIQKSESSISWTTSTQILNNIYHPAHMKYKFWKSTQKQSITSIHEPYGTNTSMRETMGNVIPALFLFLNGNLLTPFDELFHLRKCDLMRLSNFMLQPLLRFNFFLCSILQFLLSSHGLWNLFFASSS